MPVRGRLFKITQLDRFVESYLADPARPDPAAYTPLPNARVQLLGRPERPLHAEATTGPDGLFELPTPGPPASEQLDGRIIVHRRIPIVTSERITAPPVGGPTVEQVAFRSRYVQLARLEQEGIALFTCAPKVMAQVSEEELEAELASVASALELDEVVAEIREGGVKIRGKAGAATADAFVRVSPDLSERLDDVVVATVEYVEVRVPPTSSVRVTEAELAERLEPALRSVFARVDDAILHALTGQVTVQRDAADTVALRVVQQLMSVTVRRLAFPAGLGRRVIEAKPVIGMPSGLLTPRPVDVAAPVMADVANSSAAVPAVNPPLLAAPARV